MALPEMQIALAWGVETEAHLSAKFQRLRDRDLPLIAFDGSRILGGQDVQRLDVASELAMW
jgi:hypothetical protein